MDDIYWNKPVVMVLHLTFIHRNLTEKKLLNSDGQQLNQYQQNRTTISPQSSEHKNKHLNSLRMKEQMKNCTYRQNFRFS